MMDKNNKISKAIDVAKEIIDNRAVWDIIDRNAVEEILKEQEELFRTVFEQSPIGMAFSKSNGEIIDANPMYEKILGRSVAELRLLGWKRITHPEDLNKDIENFEKFKAGIAKTYSITKRYIKPDGSIVWGYLTLASLLIENGTKQIYFSMLEDITERVQIEERITRRYQVLIQESNDVFEIIKPDGTIVYMSDASEKIIGYKPEERIGKNIYDYYRNDELQKIKKMVALVLHCPDKKVEGHITFISKDGTVVYLEVSMQNLLDEPSIEGIVVNFRNITKRVEMEKKMAHISTHDELTGLPNNIYFRKELRFLCAHAKKTKTKFAVMMLDITGFKYVNDTLGYQIGDLIIAKVSKRLVKYLQEKHFLCRYAGDRFVIIVQSGTVDEYKRIAKSTIDLFHKNVKINKYEIDINLCIGISIYDKDKNINNIIRRAEMALFWAKKQGKNRFKFYSSDINIQNYKQSEIRKDLINALKNEELRVHYQPIIDLKNYEILVAEALIRWEHPDWGMISPGEFIPIAEETGLIIDIGYWLIREVCRNYRQWGDEGLPKIKVSVNISSIQFFENNFVQNIIDILNEYNIDPHFLIIEITESVFILKANNAISQIEKLRSYGILVALDDFGTGFSSFEYFKHFNIDILKIDGSFIKNVISNETSKIITESMIDLAKKLKFKLVAEGIENHAQLNYLKKLNCYAGQGYLFSKPLAKEEFEKVLSIKRCVPLDINEKIEVYEDRRKFFRVVFPNLLEVNMTIKEFRGENLNIGNSKILVKNISPGGLCFISNIRIPINKEIILQFTINLYKKELVIYGNLVWSSEVDNNLYEYGIEFNNNENQRLMLTEKLKQIRRIQKTNMYDDMLISCSPEEYFKLNM